MSEQHAEYETLKEVHEAFLMWETEGKAWDYAFTLWKTAKTLVKEIEEDKVGMELDDEDLASDVFRKLSQTGSLTKCITDDLRRLVIRYHACGVSTTDTVVGIISDQSYSNITPFYFLKYDDVCGSQNVKKFLVSRLSYLKPSHPRWPQKKFGELWRSERENYIDTIKEIPLTHPQERLQKLSNHYADLEVLYKTAENATDKERYHKCMMRTLAGIEVMTREPIHKPQPRSLTKEQSTIALSKPNDDNVIDVTPETEGVSVNR